MLRAQKPLWETPGSESFKSTDPTARFFRFFGPNGLHLGIVQHPRIPQLWREDGVEDEKRVGGGFFPELVSKICASQSGENETPRFRMKNMKMLEMFELPLPRF